MEKLIEALQIFLKYDNPIYPTYCKYEMLYVLVDPNIVSESDLETLDRLGFFVNTEQECFMSFKYGSA